MRQLLVLHGTHGSNRLKQVHTRGSRHCDRRLYDEISHPHSPGHYPTIAAKFHTGEVIEQEIIERYLQNLQILQPWLEKI